MTRHSLVTRRIGSSGGIALNILLFVGGAFTIFAIVIALHKSGDAPAAPPSESAGAPSPENTTTTAGTGTSGSGASEADYVKRGFISNKGPRVGGNDNQTVKVSVPVVKGFIGDEEYKVYHKPDCKYVKFIDSGKKASFTTGAEAFAKGYIPCKFCKPEAPEGIAQIPTRTGPDTTTGKTTTHVQPKPVSVPVRDVAVPFPYEVVGRDPINERGVMRIEYEINVMKKLAPDEVLLLAEKCVFQETAKGPISAVSLLIHTDRTKTTVRWLSMVDWAPYGILTRAGEFKPGDYKNHQFNIYDQATFKPK